MRGLGERAGVEGSGGPGASSSHPDSLAVLAHDSGIRGLAKEDSLRQPQTRSPAQAGPVQWALPQCSDKHLWGAHDVGRSNAIVSWDERSHPTPHSLGPHSGCRLPRLQLLLSAGQRFSARSFYRQTLTAIRCCRRRSHRGCEGPRLPIRLRGCWSPGRFRTEVPASTRPPPPPLTRV